MAKISSKWLNLKSVWPPLGYGHISEVCGFTNDFPVFIFVSELQEVFARKKKFLNTTSLGPCTKKKRSLQNFAHKAQLYIFSLYSLILHIFYGFLANFISFSVIGY